MAPIDACIARKCMFRKFLPLFQLPLRLQVYACRLMDASIILALCFLCVRSNQFSFQPIYPFPIELIKYAYFRQTRT